MDCLFCKIIAQEIPAEIISQDEHYTSFLDVSPRTIGHTLVVPRVHADNVLDLPEEEVGAFFSGLQKTTKLLAGSLKPDGFTIGANHGVVSGQAVRHLHFHILPRFDGDEGKSMHDIVNNPPKESLADVAEKIRNHVS